MPLETNDPVEVTQADPAYTFPVTPYVPFDERLFRHITFHETDPNLTLRIKAVNKGLGIESSVTQKHLQTQLTSGSPEQELFRIKAVLSEPEYGVMESHWVSNKAMDSQEAASHNQYRIRSVSKEKWIGDWVYSKLRGFDNELIIYNMLHDIMDLMLTVHDDQIDKLMDYIVSDTFVDILKEKMPQISRAIDEEEFKTASIEEILKIVSGEMMTKQDEELVASLGESFKTLNTEIKREFKEGVMSSQDEFSELYRAYKIFDQYESEKEDFVRLLVEIFLDERYEKLVQKTNIEVLMQNDEEMGIYLNGQYEFRIKNELMEAVHHASLDDDFVTKINDAVQLISETDVFETMVLDKTESVAKLVWLLLHEIYAPLAAADVHLLELEQELEEVHKFDFKGSVVEYTTIHEDLQVRNMLLRDVMETLLSGGDDLDPLLQGDFVEKIITPIIDEGNTLLLDYKFEEVINILLEMGESFQYEFGKLNSQPKEQKTAGLFEFVSHASTRPTRSLKESYMAALHDTQHLAFLKDPERIQETKHTSLLEVMIEEFTTFKSRVDEQLYSEIRDTTNHRHSTQEKRQNESFLLEQVDQTSIGDINQYRSAAESFSMGFSDAQSHRDINSYLTSADSTVMYSKDKYNNLFKHYLRDINWLRSNDHNELDIFPDLHDDYIFEGSDVVHYALGDMGTSGSLGVFRLGTSTLRGEV